MPILQVEIVVRSDDPFPGELAAVIADRAALLDDTFKGRTWVKLCALERKYYAEDGGGPPDGVYPVFVNILHRRRPRGEALQSEIDYLTEMIASACGRPPENVHLFYEPDAVGRVAFGGRRVE